MTHKFCNTCHMQIIVARETWDEVFAQIRLKHRRVTEHCSCGARVVEDDASIQLDGPIYEECGTCHGSGKLSVTGAQCKTCCGLGQVQVQ